MSNSTQTSSRKRIAALLDENSFVEIGGLVTARNTDFNLSNTDTPSDGVVTGYGVIDGNLVYVYSQDASVLGGTIGEMHAKKIVSIYDMAMKMGAPVIGLIDCAGIRLQEATDALDGFGQIYAKQALASGFIPQITALFGTCGGGLALIPAMSDFTFMEETNAKLFVNSPNALTGNYTSKCDTSSADFQSTETGMIDKTASEAEIFAQIRHLVTILPSNNEDDASYEVCTDDLNRVCDGIAGGLGNTAALLAQIADNHIFFETKENYGKEMVTGFIKMNGMTVGAVANRTEIYDAQGNKTESFDPVLSVKGCKKAAQFVQFCDAFEIPVVSFTNVTGYDNGCKCSEKNIAKAAASLTYAFANATVPKINVVIGSAFGSAYVTMNSKSLGADIVYAWTDAKIGMMDAKEAVKIMYADEIEASKDAVSFINEKAAEYEELQSSSLSAAKRGYVDSIIEPKDTRKYVIGALEMLFSKREERPVKKHGTV